MTIRVAVAYNFNDRDWHGGRNYFASLFRAVRAVAKEGEIQLALVLGRQTETSLSQEFPWIEVIRTSLMDRMHPLWLVRQLGLRAIDTDPMLARFLLRHRIDLLSHSFQLGGQCRVKTLPWLYDFQFMHLPQLWQRRHIRWAEQRYRAACRNGDAIVVSSEQALSDLSRFAPWCEKPKHVLRFISNPINFSALLSRPEVQAQYSLPEVYFYLPNQFWANKNHRLVIDALCELQQRGVDATVVCTGQTCDGRQPLYFDQLMEYRKQRGVEDRFMVLGVVPYGHAQSLMAHSHAVMNPSLFEGWSTTVEEAKTMHKPLLLSDIPVHREQCQDKAYFFASDDSRELAQVMKDQLERAFVNLDPARIHTDYCSRLQEFGATYLSIMRSVLR